MTISELIKILQKAETEHGDLNVAVRVRHEYWGHVDSILQEYEVEIDKARTEGPKRFHQEDCFIISSA